jgi:aryl-alcohol dehydrogenase-like predicted oxidoreductase
MLDAYAGAGFDFIDTADVYSRFIPGNRGGESETVLGNWMKARGNRDRIVLATKAGMDMGEGRQGLSKAWLVRAVDDSLRRLQTDYIDLYQVHWPDRSTNFFGRLGYQHQPLADEVPIEETLAALGDLVRAGKVRHVGISNETPWGVMRYLALSEQRGLPRVVSIQNPYSLLNRVFEIGHAEIALREQVGLLAYSPLAMGALTGKYRHGARPPSGRLTRFDRFQRYSTPRGAAAVEQYAQIAERHGLDPAQMALAFVLRQPFLTSAIVGATTPEQLRTNLASIELELPDVVIEAIEAVHSADPNPCP